MKTSLIIPTYNRADFLKEALESVFNQKRFPHEIIVVDDGSTDHTAEIIRLFPEIIYIHQNNQGVSSARNTGLKIATSEWICFLDSDDLWKPEKLFIQLQVAQEYPEIFIFHTEEVWIRNGKRVNQGKRHQKSGGWIFERCLELCLISPSSVMIHRSVFEKIGLFDETLPACEDYDLWLRSTLHYPVHFIPEPLIIKRGGHSDQLSKKFFGMDKFRVQALEKIILDPKITLCQKTAVEEQIKEKSKIYAQGCLKRDRMQEYAEYQLKSEKLEKSLL